MAKKVFISYDYDNDRYWKNLLLAWDANKMFDFTFEDTSCDCSVNSVSGAVIKRAISQKISASDCVLVIVGTQTHRSEWVTWEIERTVELGKKLVGVKTGAANTSPTALLHVGASWAMSFTFDSIKTALGV